MLVVTVTQLWYVAGIKTLNDQIVSKLECRVNLADGVNYLAFFLYSSQKEGSYSHYLFYLNCKSFLN
jgi:hypothetical protein